MFSNILFLFTPIYLGKVIQFDLHIIFKRVETQPPTNVNYPAERELRYVRGKVTSYAEDTNERPETRVAGCTGDEILPRSTQ